MCRRSRKGLRESEPAINERGDVARIAGWAAALGVPSGATAFAVVHGDLTAGIAAAFVATIAGAAGSSAAFRLQRRARSMERRLAAFDDERVGLLFETDASGRLRYVNGPAGLLGHPPGRMEERLVHEFVEGPVPYVDSAPTDPGELRWEAGWRTAAGGYRQLTSTVWPVRSATGELEGVRGVARSDHEREALQRSLEAQEARFRTVLDAAQNGIMLVDHQGHLLLGNAALSKLLDYPFSELERLSLADVVPARHLDPLFALIASRMWSDAWTGEHEVQLVARDGTIVDVEVAIAPLEDEDDVGALIEVRDMTATRRASETIRYMAEYDQVTGLPNRELFDRHVERALTDARLDERSVGILLVDLDRFKLVNETMGHTSGDRLLEAVAQRLTARLDRVHTTARLTGDQFVVLAPDLPGPAAAAAVARRALDAFEEPFEHDGHLLRIGATIGVAVYPQHAEDTETLIRVAGLAVRQGEDGPETRIRMGAGSDVNPARLRLALEGDLRRAVAQGEFELHYQPQFDPLMQIRGLEALLRWRHPQRGLVGPADFVPLLEETGLIVEVGEWVLRTACAQVQELRDASLTDARVAVNISPRQLLMPDLRRVVLDALHDSGLPPDALELELTETAATLGMDAVLDVIRELSELGVSIAIDDFGVGQSWLDRLRRLPVHTLKIDRSFVSALATSPDDLAIIEAIVGLGHALGLTVVAEGVETYEQLEVVRGVGCDLVQGFYFSRPIPRAQLERLLADCATPGAIAA